MLWSRIFFLKKVEHLSMSYKNCIFKLEHLIKGLLCRCFSKTLHCCWKDFIFPRNNFSPHVCCGLAVFCSQSFISVLRALFSINHSFVSWVLVGVSWYLPIIHVLFGPLATSVQQEAERRTASAKSIAQSRRWVRISVGELFEIRPL